MYFLCIRPQIKTCLSVCLSVCLFFRSCSGGKLPAGSGGHVGSYNWWRRKHVECGNWITRPREEGRPTYYFFLACPIFPPSHIILVAVCFVLYNVFQLSVKARLNATANITSCMACFVKIVRFWLVWIITTQNITLSLYLIPRRKLWKPPVKKWFRESVDTLRSSC